MGDPFRTIIEPFRIHSVEPIRITTEAERRAAIRSAGYNLFGLHADDVLIDLLTDSGTGAMSRDQWAGIQRGDESYAGSPSWFAFLESVQALFPFRHVIPTHQGRAAEKILFSALAGPGLVVPNNTHFDTTRANVEFTGAEAVDLVIPEGREPAVEHPFKGNMDLAALERCIDEHGPRAHPGRLRDHHEQQRRRPAGQPREPARRPGDLRPPRARHCSSTPAASPRTPGSSASVSPARPAGRSPRSSARSPSLADGMTMSAKKDGLANIGGWLALNDDALAERCRNLLILTEGFPTYGGLAGRDLEAIAQGLREVVDEDYLRYRIRSTAYLGDALHGAGVPVVRPIGGHAVYIDARALLPHVPPLAYPGQSLAVALYEAGGIRGCEIGTVMFGRHPDGSETAGPMDLVRLAIPRRTYTQSHVDYVIEVVRSVADRASELGGYRIVREPAALRHFTATFAPLDG